MDLFDIVFMFDYFGYWKYDGFKFVVLGYLIKYLISLVMYNVVFVMMV